MKALKKLLILLVVLQLAGCGTYASMQKYGTPNPDQLVMGGIRKDIAAASGAAVDPWLKKQPAYNPYIDMPFSAIADAVLLPFTLSYVVIDCVFFIRCK